MDAYVPPKAGIRLENTDTGDAYTRFWVGSRCILVRSLWAVCSEDHLRQALAEEGIHLRWFDTLKDYGPHNGMRDVYINSSILEKLYASTTTT